MSFEKNLGEGLAISNQKWYSRAVLLCCFSVKPALLANENNVFCETRS